MLRAGIKCTFLAPMSNIAIKNICKNFFLCKQLLHLSSLQLSKFQSLDTTFSPSKLKPIVKVIKNIALTP